MKEALEQILSATAMPMEPPKPYGPFHLSFMLLGFALCGGLAWLLRGSGQRRGGRIILGCALFLLATEVYKQLFYCCFLRDGGYDWGIFPFHLCSLPMYLGLIAPLLRPGRLQRSMYCFMGSFNLLGGAIAFFEPSGLLHSYLSLTLHAFLWHMCLVFMGLFLCFSGMAGDSRKDFFSASKLFLLLCVAAFGLNLVFRENSGGALNCFFIGPSDSPLVVFRDISRRFGWYVSTAIYIPALCLGAYITFRLCAAGKMTKTRERV